MKNKISFVTKNQQKILDVRGNLIVSINYPYFKSGIIKAFPSLICKKSRIIELIPFNNLKFKSSEALVCPFLNRHSYSSL
jgi:hypothetical protein